MLAVSLLVSDLAPLVLIDSDGKRVDDAEEDTVGLLETFVTRRVVVPDIEPLSDDSVCEYEVVAVCCTEIETDDEVEAVSVLVGGETDSEIL